MKYEMTGISKFIDAIINLLITTYDLQLWYFIVKQPLSKRPKIGFQD